MSHAAEAKRDSERLETARDALRYVLNHHLNGQECLCTAARSTAEAALRLTGGKPESRGS